MEKTIDDVYGKRVRLKYDFIRPEDPFVKALRAGQVQGMAVSADFPKGEALIPKGSTGTIRQNAYCGGIFDYGVEWPVQFDLFREGKIEGYGDDYTVGVPHTHLEFAEETQSKRVRG